MHLGWPQLFYGYKMLNSSRATLFIGDEIYKITTCKRVLLYIMQLPIMSEALVVLEKEMILEAAHAGHELWDKQILIAQIECQTFDNSGIFFILQGLYLGIIFYVFFIAFEKDLLRSARRVFAKSTIWNTWCRDAEDGRAPRPDENFRMREKERLFLFSAGAFLSFSYSPEIRWTKKGGRKRESMRGAEKERYSLTRKLPSSPGG